MYTQLYAYLSIYLSISLSLSIYIYIYREREKERGGALKIPGAPEGGAAGHVRRRMYICVDTMCIHICVCIYIYIYICKVVYVYPPSARRCWPR